MATKKDYVVGSGNVFADLGYARPEEAAAKAELAHKIMAEINEQSKASQPVLMQTASGASASLSSRSM